MTDARCWNCTHELDDLPQPVSRHQYCERCAEPVHCCRMCRHYDARLAEGCREDRAEPPTDKTAANFCDFFQLAGAAAPAAGDAGEAARARLDALFGGDRSDEAPSEPAEDEHEAQQAAARNRLELLFGRDSEDD